MDGNYFTRETPVLKTNPLCIFVNQAGYYPAQSKKAVLTVKSDTFSIISENGDIHYKGKTRHTGFDENSHDDVYEADFSEFSEDGLFRIADENGNKSACFAIGNSCYDKVLFDMTKAFYYLRCGCELDEKHAGKFTHAPCHVNDAVLWDNHEEHLDVSGGWHDAGDYGRYVTAAACALAHLFYGYRMFPNVLKKMNLNIPESESRTPDLLCECRYELEWLLKMQRSDGGVYHKATTAHHAPFVMPENDLEQMYVFHVSSMATADFCAILAMASGIYGEYDLEFADKLFKAAEKSYKWLENNPEFIGFNNPEGCNTGGYGERDDCDNRFWASVEMYCTTGDEKYHFDMKKALKKRFSHTALGYAATGGFGALSYILCRHGNKDNALEAMFIDEFVQEAEQLRFIADFCKYGTAMRTEDYGWGSNMNLLRHAMTFAIADKLTGTNDYRNYVAAQLDYLLGKNATGYSYVTGNGEYSYNNPHLRPAYADGIDECMPGMVSGGANRFPSDADARILIKTGTPPMKSFADDVGCYSLNEITIYWNSPAVFTAAYIIDEFKDNQNNT